VLDHAKVGETCVLLFFTTLLLFGTRTASAQGLGYGIAGPSGNTGSFGSIALHAAGGGELLVNRRAGVGGEVGILANASSVLTALSFNGVVHLLTARTSPYVTGGYSRFSSGEGSFNAWNYGVGADFWANDRVGLRIEFRDHVRSRTFGSKVHYFGIRAGIAFR
jgi:hypothetical protein